MITITENAAKQVKLLLSSHQCAEEPCGLRLHIEKGGCAGMKYQMEIDSPRECDKIITRGGVSLIVDPESLPMFEGCNVDYNADLTDSGFKINNPNAARSCDCGSSFEPKATNGII